MARRTRARIAADHTTPAPKSLRVMNASAHALQVDGCMVAPGSTVEVTQASTRDMRRIARAIELGVLKRVTAN